MDYKQTLDYLFTATPMFHREGAAAYKPGLQTVSALSGLFGSPHAKLRCIHVAGTNGKGSTAHTLAAILQAAGLRVGLFTSPHLLDFRERIRVDGAMIPQADVVSFTESFRRRGAELQPSFFELTTVMAFDYFARQHVDIAVIETGLGGRLDSTNIITPILSVITNISLDHTSLLGPTLAHIAAEKAGIIKRGVPVVIGEHHPETAPCFTAKAAREQAPLTFARDAFQEFRTSRAFRDGTERLVIETPRFGRIEGELTGDCQQLNARTVLAAVTALTDSCGLDIGSEAVREGFANVRALTGLMGRWTTLATRPLTICDTGHNPGGWEIIAPQIARHPGRKHIVAGFVADKDVAAVIALMATIPDATFHFTAPSTPRALAPAELHRLAAQAGISGTVSPTVGQAYGKALAEVVDKGSEMIFVGGSNFLVADLLACDGLDFDQHLLGQLPHRNG